MESIPKNTKILFAPHEIGGQMQLMAEELRQRGIFATSASYTQNWLKHTNDINLNLNLLSNNINKHWVKLKFTVWAAKNFDIFHFFWGESLFGLSVYPHLDLPLLRKMGKKIFVHFRGLDIVDIKYFDFLREKNAGKIVTEPPMSRPDQQRSLSKWRRYAHKILVSEPDLLRIVPEAIMVQQAIDLNYWQSDTQIRSINPNNKIRILHAPTLRRKKGTDFIERSVNDLKLMDYDVELVLVEGRPANEVKQIYESCDIAIDQVLYGWYGKFSAELMALGKPVVCYIDQELYQYRIDMPIVNANTQDLTYKLKELIDNPQKREFLSKQGLEYVSKYHDVKSIIDQCLSIYKRYL